MGNTLKVQVTVTVEIDTDAWTMNYGVEGSAAIREDVKTYVEQGITEQLRQVGVLAEQGS